MFGTIMSLAKVKILTLFIVQLGLVWLRFVVDR